MAEKPHEQSEGHGHEKPKGGHGRGGGGHGHGGGSHEEHEGAPEWLISFADNVTLMMGFFVILLAMNLKEPTTGGIGGTEENAGGAPSTDLPAATDANPKTLDLAIAIREAFHNPVDLSSTSPNDQALIRRILQRRGPSSSAQDGPRGRKQDVQSLRPTEYRGLCGAVAFARGSSAVGPEDHQTIADVANRVRGRRQIVEVRGHASAHEAFRREGDAMTLAFDRAMAVARMLAENGIDWWQLRLVACGDNDRVEPFPVEQEDGANARVEIVVTDEPVAATVPTDAGAARESVGGRSD